MSVGGGYFPEETSVLRRVHGERAVGLLYGQRALAMGALAPLNYVGTSEHTAAKSTPFKRLAHTATWFETVMLGSRVESDRVLAAVHKMHTRVHGTLPQDAGPYPQGTPYEALDPELMLWTVAVMMDSAECFYDLLVRRLRDEERESLWQDYVCFAELFGMPRSSAPATYAKFRGYYEGVLEGDGVWLTEEARYTGQAIAFELPMPSHAQPFKRVHDLIMRGSLPPRVRRLYALSWTPAHQAAFLSAVRSVRLARSTAPRSVTRGRNTWAFDMIARTEASRIARGRPTVRLP